APIRTAQVRARSRAACAAQDKLEAVSRNFISIVMPAFNEEHVLAGTVREVQQQLPAEHEILVVDDGSGDGTWDTITTMAKVDPRIRGVRLSRNFGKEAAIAAGLELARGDAARSRWTRVKLVTLAVTAILAFSPIPLFIVLGLAAIFFVVSVLLGAWALYLWAIGHAVSGFTTVILLILMSGSMILAGLGVIGLYLAKIYDEVRGRPRSVVSEATGDVPSSAASRHLRPAERGE